MRFKLTYLTKPTEYFDAGDIDEALEIARTRYGRFLTLEKEDNEIPEIISES